MLRAARLKRKVCRATLARGIDMANCRTRRDIKLHGQSWSREICHVVERLSLGGLFYGVISLAGMARSKRLVMAPRLLQRFVRRLIWR